MRCPGNVCSWALFYLDTHLYTSAMTIQTCFPQIGIGAVVFHQQRVLLVKRAKPPCAHQWTIPGGRVRAGETLQQAAEREIMEETSVRIRANQPVYTFELIEHSANGELAFHYVIIDLDADYIDGTPRPGDDALDAHWFRADELAGINLNQATEKLLRDYYDFSI